MQKDFSKKKLFPDGFLVWTFSGLLFGIADSIAIFFSNPGFFTMGEKGLLMASSIGGFIIISLIAGLISTFFLRISFSLWQKYFFPNSILALQMGFSFSFFLLMITLIADKRHLREMIAINFKTIAYNLLVLFIYISLIYGFYRLMRWTEDDRHRFSIFGGIQFFLALIGIISNYAIRLYNQQRLNISSSLGVVLFFIAAAFLSLLLYLLLKNIFKKYEAPKFFARWIWIEIALSVIFVIIAFAYTIIHIPQGYILLPSSFSKETISIKKLNCLFILIDDLRYDHLSCYEYYRKTSPHIDSLAAQGILFQQAITSSSHTSSSMSSIFTSLFPLAHGARASSQIVYGLSQKQHTLATILADNGYLTAAFVANNPYVKLTGLDRGFETYYDGNIFSKIPAYSLFYGRIVRKFLIRDVRAEHLNRQAINWLKRNYKHPFFLYIHYMDVHFPRLPYKKYIHLLEEQSKLDISKFKGFPFEEKEDREELYSIISRYDGDIRYVDEYIGELLDYLKTLHLSQNTLIILAADHGEEFFDHNTLGHGAHLYDELIKVPLILYVPAKIGQPLIVSQQVRTVDIMPTIMELLNIPASSQTQGKSLLPLIEGAIDEEERYAYGGHGEFVRTLQWKLIYNRDTESYELFNLQADPEEQVNLIDLKPEIAAHLKVRLLNHSKECMKLRLKPSETALTEEVKKRLKTLGYIAH